MSETRLIVGLGNPGKDYEYTRHNLGYLVVRCLAEKNHLSFRKSSLTNGLTAEGEIAGNGLCCLLPSAYMNNSGAAVKQAVLKMGLAYVCLLVVCDDFHLNFGQIRIRARGSDGGHNGLASVIEHLGTPAFARLRLGIGSPAKGQETAEYVLGPWTRQERKALNEFIDRAAECCVVWLRDGMPQAMDQFNGKP